MYLRNRLLEIKERLGPITKELGLRHRLHKRYDDLVLYFERRDEAGFLWRAPVSFVFPPASETEQAELTWDHIRVGVEKTSVEAIGTNGWVRYIGEYDDTGESIGEEDGRFPNVEVAFNEAAYALRAYPLTPVDLYTPYVVENENVADLWGELGPECHELGVEMVEFGRRDDNSEYYAFTLRGREIEITYSYFDTRITIDGDVEFSAKYGFPVREVWQRLQFKMDEIANETKDSKRH